jgi:predicted permease
VLASGGLAPQALHRVTSVAPGFQPENALTFSVDPPYYNDPGPQRVRYAQELLTRLRSAPGISAAGMTSVLPLSLDYRAWGGYFLQAEGAPPSDPSTSLALTATAAVTPGYFRAMGIPLIGGRDFDEHDSSNAGIAIVNETLARHYWPLATNVTGKRLLNATKRQWFTVVGVVADMRSGGLEQPVQPQMFLPYPRDLFSYMSIVVRGHTDPQSLMAAAREAARQTDPDVGIFDVQTLRQLLDRSLGTRRAYSWLFGGFAAIALVMVVAGIYGVISYSVTQRTREIGIRMALGAQPHQVLAGVLRAALALVAAGGVIGLSGAWFATRLMGSLLAGVSPHNPEAYVVIVALLTAAALLATFFPARRAASVDPVKSLKFD